MAAPHHYPTLLCNVDPEFIAAESNTDPQLVSTIPGVSFTGSKVVPTTSGTGATLAPPRPPFPGPGGSEVVNANASAAGSTLAVQQGSTQQPSPGEPASGTEIGGLLALSDRPAASSTPLESVHIRGSPAVAPVVPTAPAAPSLPSPPSLISDVASIVAASRARDIPPAVTPICPLGVVTANVSSSAVTGPPSAQCVVAAMTVEYSDLEHRCSTAWDRCR
ncbi:hypothetical protein FRC10_006118 [Ceratobasidium sp. 414]|nr:hypothetical protein FRC10_006118 [Ceratobasidium sp. 414]